MHAHPVRVRYRGQTWDADPRRLHQNQMDEWTKHLWYQKGVVNWIAYAKDGADGGGDDVEIGV